MIQETHQIPDVAAMTACVLLARTDAVLVGLSTGQGLCGVLKTLQENPETKRILFINCDQGRVYAPYVLKHQQEHFTGASTDDIAEALTTQLTRRQCMFGA